jgi:hypothetical protein
VDWLFLLYIIRTLSQKISQYPQRTERTPNNSNAYTVTRIWMLAKDFSDSRQRVRARGPWQWYCTCSSMIVSSMQTKNTKSA